MEFLAIREYSFAELLRKLTAKGFEKELIHSVVCELREKNLQSDARFAESYVQSRAARGDGPIKIRYQLKERGIDAEIISDILAAFDDLWQESAAAARIKKFGSDVPTQPKEKARQSRFLERRGFSWDQIRTAFKS